MTDGPPLDMLADGPADGPRFLFAHGAGAPMDSPWMATVAHGLAEAGLRVVRFEFPYMARRRAEGTRRPPDREPALRACWHRVLAEHSPAERAVIGGKSMGGRIAALIADEVGAAGLVCLGFPLHPAGKPDRMRDAVLRDVHTPTLVCQGTRDSLGNRGTFEGLTLSPAVRLHWLEDGDHGFKPRRASGRTEAQALAEAVATVAAFVHDRAAADR